MPKKVFISTGEASGDLHAANLIKKLKNKVPDLQIEGIGSQKMHAAGAKLILDSKKLSFIGVFGVLRHLHKIFSTLHEARKHLKQSKPDLLIIIDFGGFNLRLAKTAKQLGIKVLFYICPKIWAWRPGRIKVIKQRVDHAAVIFPFEPPYYEKENIPVHYVGNPLTGQVKSTRSKKAAYEHFQLDPKKTTLGLLPGSRLSEIRYLLKDMLEAALQLQKRYPDLQCILPKAPTLQHTDLAPYLGNAALPIRVVDGQTYDVLNICDAAIVVSGTATLETALMEVPMVIIYRGDRLSYEVLKHLIKVKFIGLCNLVSANPPIVKELIQHEASADNIAQETEKLLFDKAYRESMKKELLAVKTRLEGEGSDAYDLVKLVLEMLDITQRGDSIKGSSL